MITIKKDTKHNVLHLIYEDVITRDDYRNVLIPSLTAAFQKQSPIRILCDMQKFKKMKFDAMYDDYKFGMAHIRDFDKIAAVGDQWWMAPLMWISNIFYKVQIKHFNSHELEEAQKWICD